MKEVEFNKPMINQFIFTKTNERRLHQVYWLKLMSLVMKYGLGIMILNFTVII